ncbi:uncharacterized protein LOC129295114 [Prosopis cineraria]|uniref:uncharacterized protein LOC129295114 n=1 Tax=Prosopis cineraria TaxID=364024 RepID=UPI00240FC30E|nr:uncharacterized protein LOC129295114 [Prosopis cineraria]
MEFHDWIKWNIRYSGNVEVADWTEFFTAACWLIWKRRNVRIFEGRIISFQSISARVSAILQSMKKVSSHGRKLNWDGQQPRCGPNTWKPPPRNWFMLSVDGSFLPDSQRGGCGRVIRDFEGRFVSGFTLRPVGNDSLTTELWAILMVLKHAWDTGLRQIMVASDSLEAVILVKEGNINVHQYRVLVEEIRLMMQRQSNISLMHVSRDANHVADFLARKAPNNWPGFSVISSLRSLFLC